MTHGCTGCGSLWPNTLLLLPWRKGKGGDRMVGLKARCVCVSNCLETMEKSEEKYRRTEKRFQGQIMSVQSYTHPLSVQWIKPQIRFELGQSNRPPHAPTLKAGFSLVTGPRLGVTGSVYVYACVWEGWVWTHGPSFEHISRQVGSSSNESWLSVCGACRLAFWGLYFNTMLTTASFP